MASGLCACVASNITGLEPICAWAAKTACHNGFFSPSSGCAISTFQTNQTILRAFPPVKNRIENGSGVSDGVVLSEGPRDQAGDDRDAPTSRAAEQRRARRRGEGWHGGWSGGAVASTAAPQRAPSPEHAAPSRGFSLVPMMCRAHGGEGFRRQGQLVRRASGWDQASTSGLPMLKTAAESYTRKIYLDFEEQFKEQFSFSCKLFQTEGTNMVYKVMPMGLQDGAIVLFNSQDMTVTCILCKHAIRVFNINEVFILPTQYILHRWTKYAKRGFMCEKQRSKTETLKARAARISRKATSVALKCSVSEELLDDLEKAIDKLDLEADNSVSQRPDNSCEVSQSSNDNDGDILKGKISIRVPEAKKGPKTKRGRDPLEKNKGKNKKTAKKKEGDPGNAADKREPEQDPKQLITPFDASIGANMITQNIATNSMSVDSSTMGVGLVPGGFTNLLLGFDQDISAARRITF